MSKKATRRAARQAFPKAKNPATTKSGARTRTRTSAASRSRTAPRQTNRPPSIKRAATQAVIMAALYFVFIQWLWKSGATTIGNVLVSLGAFIIFTGVVYGVDKFKYQRKLRKAKESSK
jgi:predicted phage tail protein